jgi:hypothetical protein
MFALGMQTFSTRSMLHRRISVDTCRRIHLDDNEMGILSKGTKFGSQDRTWFSLRTHLLDLDFNMSRHIC